MTVSILGDNPDCPKCGTTMDACVTYHARLKETVAAWACPSCEHMVVREDR